MKFNDTINRWGSAIATLFVMSFAFSATAHAGVLTWSAANSAVKDAREAKEAAKNAGAMAVKVDGATSTMCRYKDGQCQMGELAGRARMSQYDYITPNQFANLVAGRVVKVKSITYVYIDGPQAVIEFE